MTCSASAKAKCDWEWAAVRDEHEGPSSGAQQFVERMTS